MNRKTDFIGNVRGSIIGNVGGNVRGDVIGDVIGKIARKQWKLFYQEGINDATEYYECNIVLVKED